MNGLGLTTGYEAAVAYLRACGVSARPARAALLDRPTADRLIADYAIDSAHGPARHLIGKCYGDDRGAQVFVAMCAIERALRLKPPQVLAIPRPLCYDVPRRCLLMERVEAAPLSAHDDRLEDALAATGQALAELHHLDVGIGAVKRFDDHVRESMSPHPDQLQQLIPALAPRIADILAGSRELAGDDAHHACVHRDLHLRQLFRDARRVWIVDWDLCARGDGALDLGNFVMGLTLKLGPRARAGIDAFLAGYLSHGAEDADLFARVAAYQALSYLRRACKAFRLRGNAGLADIRELLTRAEATLAFGIDGGLTA